ncbi:hypothetical protein DSECCO2_345370 [anaerobic digester metagenome]
MAPPPKLLEIGSTEFPTKVHPVTVELLPKNAPIAPPHQEVAPVTELYRNVQLVTLQILRYAIAPPPANAVFLVNVQSVKDIFWYESL